MLFGKRVLKWGLTVLTIVFAIILIGSISVQAQYWTALPPYNFLWPLWSPALSPLDTAGFATPLISQLTKDTVLPVQPGLVWDPAQLNPWLLYNTPSVLGGNLLFFDQFYGLNPWPPSYLIDPLTKLPVPIGLPLGYDLLPPTLINNFGPVVTTGNLFYNAQYPTAIYGIPLSSLLTPAAIWGLPPL